MAQFTCNVEGAKRTTPEVREAVDAYRKANEEFAATLAEVAKESGIEVLQTASQKFNDVVDNSVLPNVRALGRTYDTLEENIKKVEDLTSSM